MKLCEFRVGKLPWANRFSKITLGNFGHTKIPCSNICIIVASSWAPIWRCASKKKKMKHITESRLGPTRKKGRYAHLKTLGFTILLHSPYPVDKNVASFMPPVTPFPNCWRRQRQKCRPWNYYLLKNGAKPQKWLKCFTKLPKPS